MSEEKNSVAPRAANAEVSGPGRQGASGGDGMTTAAADLTTAAREISEGRAAPQDTLRPPYVARRRPARRRNLLL